MFFARGIIAGVFQAIYVYTPEVKFVILCDEQVNFSFYCLYSLLQVYPTPLRSIGLGTCSAMARLGAMVTPYIAQVHTPTFQCIIYMS